jgi:phage gpG-like protein
MTRVTIRLSDEARRVVARYRALPARMLQAVARAMDEQNQLTIGVMVEKRLSFPREMPPTPDGLRVITNTLRKSVLARPVEVGAGGVVRSSIGSAVRYAALHEFGGVAQRPEHTRRGPPRVSLGSGATLSVGAAVRAGILTARGAVRRGDRNTRLIGGGVVRVRAHTAAYPARAFVRRTLEERVGEYGRAMSEAIVAAARGDGG